MRVRTAVVLIGLAVFLGVVALAQEGRKITGVVETASGLPVVNALVSYAERGGELRTTQTDSKGKFEIPYATSGVVTVTARDYATAKRSWPPRRGSSLRGGSSLRFTLRSPSVVAGKMQDAVTRRAVTGIVSVLVQNRFNHVADSARANGTFTFNDLPDGPAIVYAHADGFAPYYGEATVEAGKRTELQLDLLLEAVARGQVVDGNGSAVVGARVHVGYESSMRGREILSGLTTGYTMTVDEGIFRIRGLVPDTPIALQAEHDGRRSDVVTVTIPQGMERSGLVLRMP